MDVLTFTSFREQALRLDQLNTAIANVSTLSAEITTLSCLSPNVAHESYRWMCYDSPIDVKNDNSNVVCVFDASSFSANALCTWTVPAGTTKARFEIWGPGSSGGSGGSCCGFTPWGTSGSFLAFTLNVTPGCQYTLCAGNSGCTGQACMYCCGCTEYFFSGCYASCCSSFVTGFGIATACAPGGRWDLVGATAARYCSSGVTTCTTPTRWSSPESPGFGPCICFCSTLCFSSSPTCRTIKPQADWLIRPCVSFSNCNVVTLSIPTMHQGGYLSSANYGAATLLPPYPKCGWRAASACSNILPGNDFTEYNHTSGSCNGCQMSIQAHCCCMSHPGLGGSWAKTMGGTTAYYGDRGRAGMVKVIYC